MKNIAEIIGSLKDSGTPDNAILYIRDRLASSKATHPWEQVCAGLESDQVENERVTVEVRANAQNIVHQIGQMLLNNDELSWHQRIEWCKTPEDFRRLFVAIGIPDDKWKSPTWMITQARLSLAEGGIGRILNGLANAIKNRFGYHSEFVAWMEGKSFTSIRKGIKACRTREDFLRVFAEIGIPGDNWKNTGWLYNKSKLPLEEGGIGQQLGHIPQYINDDDRFASFPHFVAWMEGKEEPDDPLTVRIKGCKEPKDFLGLFEELGIPGDNWMNSKWLGEKARLPVQEGGIGRNLVGLLSAIRKDERFKGYRKFVAWMEGKEEPDPFLIGRVRECDQREDFLRLFSELGVPDNKWRTSTWFTFTAKLPVEEGGLGRSLSGVIAGIRNDARFESFPHFVAWMDGKTEVPKSWPKKVAACKTREDFNVLFEENNIQGESWKNYNWMAIGAKEPPEKGGVGHSLAGLAHALSNDERFGNLRAFVAWMENREGPDPTFKEMVEACVTRDDFNRLFQSLGIPGDKWKNSHWLESLAVLPPEQGGIGRSMQGIASNIRDDNRFRSYPRFVKWMEGEELLDDYEKPQREQWIDKVRSCKIPTDFLSWFRELGIAGNEWKNSRWLTEGSILPVAEGGIGRNIGGIVGAIKSDGRFEGFREFVAWMEGKEGADLSNRQKVKGCKTQEDFRGMFASLGVLGDEWKNSRWFTDTAKLPPEQGGIGKEGLTSLPAVIGEDDRFESYPHFVAWMEGTDVEDAITKQVRNCITPEDFLAFFTKIGIPGEQWKSGTWLRETSRLSPEEGGISKSLISIGQELQRDVRFGSHRKFVAWMDGEEELDDSLLVKARTCEKKEEYISLFSQLGIPNGRWKNHRWMQSKPLLKSETAEVNMPLEGIVIAVREKFDSYKKFVAWMDGKDQPDLPWKERIIPLSTPNDFRDLFTNLGIPNEAWRSSEWLSKTAIRPPEEGGISQPLQGLCDALRKRFSSFPKFITWMDGKDRPKETMVDVVKRCRKPDDFIVFLRIEGAPEDAWEEAMWFTKKSKLPPEEGGIGRNMSGFPGAITNDGRWKTYAHFKGWMQGKEGPALSYPQQVARCKTREDFLEWFAELGIPDDKWKDGPWLSDIARLPQAEGGIGQSMGAMASSIRNDGRFGGYPQFIAWMESEDYEESLSAKVKKCKDRNDYLHLFQELGIPGDKWRNTNWIRNVASLPPEKGGIGKKLPALPFYVRKNNPDFSDYPHFVAWMDGMPLKEITSPQEAEKLLRLEAERLGVSTADLLDEHKIHDYISQSPILVKVMEYFSSLGT